MDGSVIYNKYKIIFLLFNKTFSCFLICISCLWVFYNKFQLRDRFKNLSNVIDNNYFKMTCKIYAGGLFFDNSIWNF